MAVPGSDGQTVPAALRLAVRAPSVHNCRPWRWLVGPGTVHLYLDGSGSSRRPISTAAIC